MPTKKTKRYVKGNGIRSEANDSVDPLRILARLIANKLLFEEEKGDRPE